MTNPIKPLKSRARGGPYDRTRKIKGAKFKMGDIVTLSVWLMYSEGCVILEVLPDSRYLVQLGPGFGGTFDCKEDWLEYDKKC